MKKSIKRICRNCGLFDPKSKLCGVVILHQGERINLPMEPEDPCFFDGEYFNPISGQTEAFSEVQQVRVWEEDHKVKIEFPDDFFGPGIDAIL